jgi:hypothetical protein
MYHDNYTTDSDLVGLSPQTLYRGMYVRVSGKLGVDPSYVSRVARGERQSPEVQAALAEEIDKINKKLRSPRPLLKTKRPQHGSRAKRLRFFVAQKRHSLRQEWLQCSQADPNIRRIKISSRRRLSPVFPVVDEALNTMNCSLKEIASKPLKAAKQHGKERRGQGYSPTTLLEEYNLIRRCIYRVAKRNFMRLDPELLVHDLGQLGEILDLQSQSAIRAFLSEA